MTEKTTALNNPYYFKWDDDEFGFTIICGDCGEVLMKVSGAPAAHLENSVDDTIEVVVDEHAYCNHRPEEYDPPDTADMGQNVAWRESDGTPRPVEDYWRDLGFDADGKEREYPNEEDEE